MARPETSSRLSFALSFAIASAPRAESVGWGVLGSPCSALVTFVSRKVNRNGAESVHETVEDLCCNSTLPGHARTKMFCATMDRRSAFSRTEGAPIVPEEMFQHREGLGPGRSSAIEFSERDREDAARLLTMILGRSRAEREIRDRDAVSIARAILEDRKQRSQIFNRGMFGEPAWELLLNLYIMDKQGPRLTIGGLVQIAGVAQATALRWLDYLKVQGLITREEHPTDSRTAIVTLTDKARDALGMYLSRTLTPRL